ncbi:unnamed protein product [Prorocentrum cordatum]|uniref:PNPLA domain-containing protein n=1 Tax=Prorocentrum cordatum TaxID=2364126 RepID=A0ABN9WM12_9DINO|nr:unnamed protein product [Polarella glacialis]
MRVPTPGPASPGREAEAGPRPVALTAAGRAGVAPGSMERLIQRLRDYAKEQVEGSQAAANLERVRARCGGGPLVLDVALPGAAYFSVAAGGMAEVLHLLGGDGHVQVDRFIGASGGACSLFLIVAGMRGTEGGGCRCPDSEVLLRSYLDYGESEGVGPVHRGLSALGQVFVGVSSFWENRYRELLRDPLAFAAIRRRAFVAVAARPLRAAVLGRPRQGDGDSPSFLAASDNYVFSDFETEEQAVQAFVATGEATGKGFLRGIRGLAPEGARFALHGHDGATAPAQVQLPHSFCDGGHPVGLWSLGDERRNATLYYYTMFSEACDALFSGRASRGSSKRESTGPSSASPASSCCRPRRPQTA